MTKETAKRRTIHRGYCEIKKVDFYQAETTVDGKRFVTSEGWVDLSDMMKLYEQLVRQYLQSPAVARSFALYCDLFRK